MEWLNSGITTLKHTICAPNVFQIFTRKPNNYQLHLRGFLKFCDNISHKLLRPSQFLEKTFWTFWNTPLCKKESCPPPYSVLQHIGRVATPKLVPRNCLRYLQTVLIIAPRRFVLEFMWGIVVRFKIQLRIVLFINGLLLALTFFCFSGAVLLSVVLQIFIKEPSLRIFLIFLHSLFIRNQNLLLKNFLYYLYLIVWRPNLGRWRCSK